jgi:D-ribose pyranose/furanose isomerase RbsD
MYVADLIREDGFKLELRIPEKPEEVTLKQFVNFDIGYSKLMQKLTTISKDKKVQEKSPEYAILLMRLMKDLYPECSEALGNMDISKEANRTAMEHTLMLQMAQNSDAVEKTITSFEKVLNQFYKLVYKWQPEMPVTKDYKFKHGGKFYVLPSVRKDLTFNRYEFEGMTLEKLVETTEIHRMINKRVKQNELLNKENHSIANKQDPDGSLAFTKLIHTLAMVVEEEGKPTPLDPKKFDKAVRERVVAFQDVSQVHARTATFFLLSTKHF